MFKPGDKVKVVEGLYVGCTGTLLRLCDCGCGAWDINLRVLGTATLHPNIFELEKPIKKTHLLTQIFK